jgi:hypothetical protein
MIAFPHRLYQQATVRVRQPDLPSKQQPTSTALRPAIASRLSLENRARLVAIILSDRPDPPFTDNDAFVQLRENWDCRGA